MRIVSLLPSATEMICTLGLEGQLVGVTHECDYPPSVSCLPKVTCTLVPAEASSAPHGRQAGARRPYDGTYRADIRAIREAAKISQSQFAKLIGLNLRTTQNWERRRTRPTGPARQRRHRADGGAGVALERDSRPVLTTLGFAAPAAVIASPQAAEAWWSSDRPARVSLCLSRTLHVWLGTKKASWAVLCFPASAAVRLPTGCREAWMANERIEINPKIMMGKPVIRGTRIPVELILRKLGEGASEDDLLDAYPKLTREDLRAAMLFAADTVAHEETAHTD